MSLNNKNMKKRHERQDQIMLHQYAEDLTLTRGVIQCKCFT